MISELLVLVSAMKYPLMRNWFPQQWQKVAPAANNDELMSQGWLGHRLRDAAERGVNCCCVTSLFINDQNHAESVLNADGVQSGGGKNDGPQIWQRPQAISRPEPSSLHGAETLGHLARSCAVGPDRRPRGQARSIAENRDAKRGAYRQGLCDRRGHDLDKPDPYSIEGH
ncbi:hypothetical protein [Phyllobacterium sp. 21LDTY02-6]|uniref:hypothetical protein n=1 Tax=Phyllobacterium sp. 21LDTY02-6 TaxID=2944903 RepID=UPI002021BC3F|nr:hypothetical protein [Phyllobacterium sp. 21LDTY02-6]